MAEIAWITCSRDIINSYLDTATLGSEKLKKSRIFINIFNKSLWFLVTKTWTKVYNIAAPHFNASRRA